MNELEKLEKELLEEIQEEPEIYTDTEEFCTINTETRIITVPTSKRTLGTESDQETNRLYFKCPKIVGDNVDLSLFSLRINYQNAGNKKDQYLVEDVKEEGDNITFSWLLKRNVTAYKGKVKFILCAVKTTEDGAIKNEWNTTLNDECECLEGMEVDQTAVEEETKDIVEQLIAMMNHSAENAVRAVEEAKAEVDKEVGDFALKAQQALADVNNAGQTQTERVQSAGTTAVESVKTAQGTATRAVETAKSEAIKAVQAEGTTQVGNVSAEGEKQVQAVRGAAQEIMADREQIQENKTGIAKLKEDIVGLDNRKADAIVETASGNPCNISDSSGLLIKKLNIYGESTQEGTPSPVLPVPIISKEISKITVAGKELEKQETILSKPITLRGIPVESGGNVTIDGKQYVSDIICEHNGIISVERNVEKALLKKDIVFTQTKDNPYRCACFTAIIGGKKFKYGASTSLSNCFPWVAWASNVNSSGDKTVFSVNEECIYISLPRTGAEPSKEEAENRVNELWQSVKDKVEFYARLKMPVYEPLPEADQDAIKNLHSYYPNTTIKCGAWTEVEYVADTKEFFLNQNQSLQKQILEIQNALISQKISGGGIIQVKDSAKLPIQNLRVFGKSEQNGVPSIESPSQIINIGNGGIPINIMGRI